MTLSIIVATAEDWAIGGNNQLLWHLSGDLKRFKETTTHHTIVMGRNTFLSLPKGALPNRRNVVISSTATAFEGAEVFPSWEAFVEQLKKENCQDEVFVIGGRQLYCATLPLVDKIYWTQVHAVMGEKADTFFPEVCWDEWQEISSTFYPKDERNEYDVTLTEYIRKDTHPEKIQL